MPVVFCKINYDGYKHRKGLFFVGFKNVEKVIIFKEAHCSVSNLQMDTPNALHDSLKKSRDQRFNLLNFANFKYLLKLRQKQCFFHAVSERPVFKKTLK